MVAGTINKPLTDKEKDELLKQVLGKEYTKSVKNFLY